MMTKRRNNGSVILMAVFAIVLLSALVIGILEMATEEIQLMGNQIYSAQAMCVAEAGLNDAMSKIRIDDEWDDGFTDKSFGGGSYTVTVAGTLPTVTIVSIGTSPQEYIARVEAKATVGGTDPYAIRIDNLRINN